MTSPLAPIGATSLSRTAQGVQWTKRRLRATLARPSVSRPLTAAVRPLAPALSVRTLLRLPVTRRVEVRSPLCQGSVVLDAAGVDPIASLLYWRGLEGWEPETLPSFLRLVTPGALVVDVGANTGLFSLLAARRHDTVTVHAVEPVPRVFELLTANVARNRAARVSCHRMALSDHDGSVTMYVPREDVPIMASMLPDWRSDCERIDVPSQSLDQFVGSLDMPVGVLKVDTEGTEVVVLAGGARMLKTDRPFVICEVLAAGGTADDLTTLMTDVDYRMFRLEEGGPRPIDRLHGNTAEGCRNYLFVPRERVEEARQLLGMPA